VVGAHASGSDGWLSSLLSGSGLAVLGSSQQCEVFYSVLCWCTGSLRVGSVWPSVLLGGSGLAGLRCLYCSLGWSWYVAFDGAGMYAFLVG